MAGAVPPRGDAGLSMLEVLVAMSIGALCLAAMGHTLVLGVNTAASSEARVVAANLASSALDRIRSAGVAGIPDGDTTTVVDAGGRSYSVRTRLYRDTYTSTGIACEGASGIARFRRISVEVTWPRMGSVLPVMSDTLQALPVEEADGTGGVLAVAVYDSRDQPAANVPVRLQPIGVTVSTSSDGCAVFPGLAPRADYVLVVDIPGWVGPSGAQRLVRGPLTVQNGSVVKAQKFIYDQAGSLTVDIPAPAGYAFPGNPGLTLGNGLIDGGVATYRACGVPPCASGLASGPLTVDKLFPAADGYAAWPGICSDAHGGTGTTVAVPPGGTGTGTAVPGAGVTVTWDAAAASSAVLWAVHDADADCPAGQSFSLGSLAPGGSIDVALPAGLWRFAAETSPNVAPVGGVSAFLVGGEVTWVTVSP